MKWIVYLIMFGLGVGALTVYQNPPEIPFTVTQDFWWGVGCGCVMMLFIGVPLIICLLNAIVTCAIGSWLNW